jgi:hypothetical protein
MPNTLPDWYTPEAPPVATAPVQPQQAAPAQLPDWYTPEAESVTSTASKPESFGEQVGDLAANIGTGVARVPGAIVGVPHTLAHAGNWLWAQFGNAWNGVRPDGTWREGKDYDESNPLTKHTLSSEEVDKGVFDAMGVKPYEPESFVGKLLQAGVTGAGAGALDPFALLGAVRGGSTGLQALEGAAGRAGRMAVASDAANATQQAFPDDPGLSVLSAVAAHNAAGTAVPLAKAGFNNTVRPLLSPTARGRVAAGNALADVDNTGPGMASPSNADVAAAKGKVAKATGDIGVGQDDYDAGGALRDTLQARKDALVADRKAASAASRAAFEAEPPMSVKKLEGFLQRPSFRRALIQAGAGVKDEGGNPTVRYWDVEGAGAPTANGETVPGVRMRVSALPPEVLDRVKGHLDDAVNEAPAGSRAQRTATILRDQFKGLLDEQYPNTYPKTREDYAANSRPLDPLETGATGKVLDSENRFGTRVYSMPQDKVVRAYLQQNSPSVSAVKNLTDAFGGDKKAALGALQDNLVSKVQDAINSDGTLSQQAFERAVRPYTKALGMHFPELARKFSNAQAAQKTFELVTEQKALADDIGANRALRGSDGYVTRDSALKWLDQHEDALERTQSKAAVMRLRKIAEALPDDPAAGAQAAAEAAPMVVGGILGGSEGGVLGGITHKIPAAVAAPLLKRYYNSYSDAIERAFADPQAAADLAAKAQKFGGFRKVLTKAAKDAALATPTAVNAGTPASSQ